MQRSVVHTHNHWTDLSQATRYFESILFGVKRPRSLQSYRAAFAPPFSRRPQEKSSIGRRCDGRENIPQDHADAAASQLDADSLVLANRACAATSAGWNCAEVALYHGLDCRRPYN